MALIKTRVHHKNALGTYDTFHYETSADVVLYTNNSQTTVSGALDTLFTDMSGKAASSHNHAGSAITSGTVAAARLGTMTGATTSADGASGAVPKPTKGAATRYLRSDGTWQVPPDNNTTYSNMTAATADAAGKAGLVPAPAAGKQTSFLRGDGTWVVPDTKYTHPSYTAKSSGLYKITVDATGHVSAATAVAKADITALGIPGSDNNTTYTFATGDSNGQIKVTPSGGTAQNVAVKGLGSAAYTASTAYKAAYLAFYGNQATAVDYYVTTNITASDTGNTWVFGEITGTKGTSSVSLVKFTARCYKFAASSGEACSLEYWTPTNTISEMNLYRDDNRIVYLSFKLTAQYSRLRVFVDADAGTGSTNKATAIAHTTAPATFAKTYTGTRVYENRNTISIGSASAGVAIAADDITAWDDGSLPALTITSTACDDITAWSAGTAASASVANGVLTITNGTAPSLSYTARSVGSASDWSAGTLPKLTYTARSIPNISVSNVTVAT